MFLAPARFGRGQSSIGTRAPNCTSRGTALSNLKGHPILFSAPMVRALLAGTKTQTRRVMKLTDLTRHPDNDPWYKLKVWSWRLRDSMWTDHTWESLLSRCPYGQPGDLLWVRETWGKADDYHFHGTVYKATDDEKRLHLSEKVKWHPSIHMFRHDSRITLEVTGVRVERLQDISVEDCIAEGVSTTLREHDAVVDLRDKYRTLWESINGTWSWDANRWVWVIDFKRVTQ